MFRRLQALMWLRLQVFLTNKNILVPAVMPYALVCLFRLTMGADAAKGMALMSMCYSMGLGMAVGNPISAMIAEEKEKKNLNTILLSGVRPLEYFLSVLLFPLLISLVNLVLFPLMTQTDLSSFWVAYSVKMLLTAMVSIAINFYIGSRSVSQSTSQILAMLFTLFISLAPSLSLTNEQLATVIRCSFLGAYMEFFENPQLPVTSWATAYSAGWLLLVAILLLIRLRRSDKSSWY